MRIAVRDLTGSASWEACVDRLRARPGFWLLDAAREGGWGGGWSLAGADPLAVVRASGDRVEIEPGPHAGDAPGLGRRVWHGDPLAALRELVPRAEPDAAAAAIPFVGGAVGWLGYELAAQIERVPIHDGGDLVLPDLAWQIVDAAVAHEPATGRLVAAAIGPGDAADRNVDRLLALLLGPVPPPSPNNLTPENLTPGSGRSAPGSGRFGREPVRMRDGATGLELDAFFDADSYARAVAWIQAEIAAGEVYQANLTHRLAATFGGDAWRLYRALRARAPAPFASFLSLPGITVVGASPERFLRVEPDGRVETRPIKGTRPRGATPDADRRLEAELRDSEKERAENAMIVDLMRNDLGRVCAVGSVEATELFAIERHATLFQMVSTVRGRLRPDRDRVDLLRAAFPPGSMTGAPKLAAIALLARIEPVRRGVYAGALGYLDARGGADLCVVIRSLLCRGRRAWLHVGGGIVMDSDPAAEWEETLAKARAPLDALAAVQGGGRLG